MTNHPAATPDVDNAMAAPSGLAISAGIARGVMRLLAAHAIAALPEVPLPDGRRADLVAIATDGTISIIEIKSGLADYRSDHKWPGYRAYCDQLYFAVDAAFPLDVLPDGTGVITADRYGGAILREAPVHKLAPARRKAMTLRLARIAAARLSRRDDPAIATEGLER
jgi:hypothetical protein